MKDMKKKAFLATMAFAIASSNVMAGTYRVKGKVANHGGRIVLVTPNLNGGIDTLATSINADGSFDYKGQLDEPVSAELRAYNTRLAIPLILEDATAEVEADAKRPSAYAVKGGGEMQQIATSFRKKEYALIYEADSVKRMMEKEYANDPAFGRIQVKGMMQMYNDKYDKLEDEFIRENDNIVSATILGRRLRELVGSKQITAKYAMLGDKAKATVYGKIIKPWSDKISHIIVGGTAPDLTMNTPDGKPLSIHGVKAKVKIIDFWASWCGPCRAENPNVKKIYAKYHDKGLEIISISLDAKVEPWKAAIEKDQLPWLHISDLKGWNSVVTDVYEIHAIPQLFVLDADNKIIAEGLRGEELEQFIAGLFK